MCMLCLCLCLLVFFLNIESEGQYIRTSLRRKKDTDYIPLFSFSSSYTHYQPRKQTSVEVSLQCSLHLKKFIMLKRKKKNTAKKNGIIPSSQSTQTVKWKECGRVVLAEEKF